MLTKIEIEKLLGIHDHKVEFGREDGYHIIIGPNGVGKTKLLEIVEATLSLKLVKLGTLPFVSAHLHFEDNISLKVSKKSESNVKDNRFEERFGVEVDNIEFQEYYDGNKTENHYTFDVEKIIRNTLNIRDYRRGRPGFWYNRYTDEEVELKNLDSALIETNAGSIPAWIKNRIEHNKCTIIDTQRLTGKLSVVDEFGVASTRSRHREHVSQVDVQSNEMKRLIANAQTQHSEVAQKLDRKFPERILSAKFNRRISDNELKSELERQDELRQDLERLSSLGLGKTLTFPERQLEDWERKLLLLHIQDTDEKLEPLKHILGKIKLMEEIVNSRLLNKSIEISSSDGIVAKSISGENIDLNALSSGEQHELVLAFTLLFNVDRGNIVLIDEPEISLHVAWQSRFIKDVERIAKLSHFKFIVATHSPYIIGGAWEYVTDLFPEGSDN